MFVRNTWYVAAWSSEVTSGKLLARRILDVPMVFFRDSNNVAAVLHDQCCHRGLPLSLGVLESGGIRCGYHGMKYDRSGVCIEIPGQGLIPKRACVRTWPLVEQNGLIWIWPGEATPDVQPPAYPWHGDWLWKGGLFHYEAAYELIHDNLLDLSHLGYVHVHTIGGDPSSHMNAEMRTTRGDGWVCVERFMREVAPPPTHVRINHYTQPVDRWQRIQFVPGLISIYSGSVPAGTLRTEGDQVGGFQQRVFNAITPETHGRTHYFWSISHQAVAGNPGMTDTLYQDTVATFEEDRLIVNAQYARMMESPTQKWVDLGIDAGSIQARRII
ncbi:MAG: aromatic ring-hydroxylating dioxygenase subunit alpha, partial [Rubrivivax sp.]